MKKNIDKLRKEYHQEKLDREQLAEDPLDQFHYWFEEACQIDLVEPNAFILASTDATSKPSLRTVLMKAFDQRGLIFFTNYGSRKSKEIELNPHVSALFLWKELERQVIVEGKAEKASKNEAVEYFAKRPRKSQIGAWASKQDSVVDSRKDLEESFVYYENLYSEQEIPLPPFWGGFHIKPYAYEFWQGRESRLHDRFRYRLENDQWIIERISP